MAKGKKKTTLWVVLAAVILAIFALGKLGGSEPGTTADYGGGDGDHGTDHGRHHGKADRRHRKSQDRC